jgi:hydroxyacylglutathione hydrolase
MKKMNKLGWPLAAALPAPQQLGHAALPALLNEGALVIDLRPRQDYARVGVPGTINVPTTDNSFLTTIGWFVDYSKPLYLVAPVEGKIDGIMVALHAIGIDDVPGFFTPAAVEAHGRALPVWTSAQLAERLPKNGLIIVDVRGKTEYDERHISGARHIPLGHLPRRMDELPRDRMLITQCASGYRSQVAASYLRAHGFEKVATLNDTMQSWSQVLPIESRIPA